MTVNIEQAALSVIANVYSAPDKYTEELPLYIYYYPWEHSHPLEGQPRLWDPPWIQMITPLKNT